MEILWLTSLICCLSIPIVLIILRSFRNREKLKLPPGPPKLPIIGNIHQLASKKTPPHHRLEELAQVYGPIMHLHLGEVPTVVISSAELAKLVMRTHDANFANRPKLMLAKYLYYDYSDIALAPYGEYWRQVRKIATLELFTTRRVQSFRAIREEETTSFVKSIASEAAQACVINLSERVFGLIFDLTSRAVFNQKGKEPGAFRALTALTSKVSSGFLIADLYPSIKLLHSISGVKKTLKEMVEESNRILDPVIQNHQSNTKQGKVDQEDLVDVLLKFQKDNPHDSVFSLTNNSIKAIILKIYHDKDVVDESSLDELKFLKMVIKETLRLHPPVPLLVPRESIGQCQIRGYDIPSKTRVMVNVRAIGRDPNYWPEANMFKPERFEASSVDYKGNDFELIPFGAGRRMCPGVALGIANIELPLAMLLYHFDWKLPNGTRHEDLNMDELFGITVRIKNDLHVIPIPYEHSCFSK